MALSKRFDIPTSIQSSKDIYVSLFGELSISTSKGVLKEADFSSPSINRLISYLLISRKNAISPQEITQTLWPDDSDNPAKNVKGLVYRLRQKFSIISDEPLVLSSASGYQLNPELHIMTDYQRFDELVSNQYFQKQPNSKNWGLPSMRLQNQAFG